MRQSSRYQKQVLFHGIGPDGQRALAEKTVLLVGCGALGCALADQMTRAGIGRIRIVDRDFVELSNLQRQCLFTEHDVENHLPKAVAAADRLRQVNSEIQIEPVVADVRFDNIRDLLQHTDLILDGTDNFEVRYLLNDAALEFQIPWIFTGCTGSHGQMMPVIPGQTACLRCLIPSPPPPGSTETCDTAGVLGPAISAITALQSAVALQILTGQSARIRSQLSIVDVWDLSFRQVDVDGASASRTCPACAAGERLWLRGQKSAESTILCGRNAVQVSPAESLKLTLPDVATRLRTAGNVVSNAFLVRVTLSDSDLEITVFADGRAIIKGTEDTATARSVYSRYVGT